MNNTSLMSTVKVVLPMMRNGALEEANRNPMPKAAGAPSKTALSLVKLLRRRPMTTVNFAKSTENRPKPYHTSMEEVDSGWKIPQ